MIPVKICGITRIEDAREAISLGASAIGFIFYEKSPRYIQPDEAAAIIKEVAGEILTVGVFVNTSAEKVNGIAAESGLDLVQLHGDEPASVVDEINVPVIKAFRVRDDFDPGVIGNYNAQALLFDAYKEGEYGGTGERFDWSKFQPVQNGTPYILAGGLTPENVRDALTKFQPYAIDVSSGVEVKPGFKDHQRMEQLFQALQDTREIMNPFSANTHKRQNRYQQPDQRGHYGEFGGKYVPETLIPALEELEQVYQDFRDTDEFNRELDELHRDYTGRPSPLTYAPGISAELDLEIYMKREDLNHTGAHKINNTLGQILLAKKMGKSRIIAETGAGQHGVATATVAAKFGLECIVYMGEEDIERQSLNVFRMELLGAEVRPVSSGSKTLKDATNEAIRDWVANVEDTYYLIGSVVGPHPYPMIVRDFQTIIGREAKDQFREKYGGLPDALVACVGGGSNAIGLFYPFLDDDIRMFGVEASGAGVETHEHAATIAKGSVGMFHGAASYLLQDENGQVQLAHSISAGLDYPGIGPEHSYLKIINKVEYLDATDDEAVEAFQWLSRKEGIIPALESAHALAALQQGKIQLDTGSKVVLCLSGRGDKDVNTVADYLGRDLS